MRALCLSAALAGLPVAPGMVLAAAAEDGHVGTVRLVLGSFRARDNADGWALELSRSSGYPFAVSAVQRDDGDWYRVVSAPLDPASAEALGTWAEAHGHALWRKPAAEPHTGAGDVSAAAAEVVSADVFRTVEAERAESAERAAPAGVPGAEVHADFDLGVQTRGFSHTGLDGQDRFQPSVSARFEYRRAWNDDRSRLVVTPFLRYDAVDDERTHADLRELYWSQVGDDWEFHLGARQIFWGVTEFKHLVDVINQTDFVEDVDGEDKLGQPMAQVSLVRDWGIIDAFLLLGFRERTFPGPDGRLRGLPPVDTDHAEFVSGAENKRIDGAIRWSHYVGPVSFGLYHFSGTDRDPHFLPELQADGIVLKPVYDVIDQTGFDGQAIFGDWTFKLEAMSRTGSADQRRFEAYTVGFERTLVGVLGGGGDLGLVVEYMHDERDELAYNTLFEHDVALGARWQANDLADTAALFGVILDTRTDEYVISLEASRRLGATWTASLEGRVFGGAPDAGLPLIEALLDGDIKSVMLQDDDYVQLEITRYF